LSLRDTSRAAKAKTSADVHDRLLKGSIALEVGEEWLVRDDGLVAALGYDGEIFQVFEQFLRSAEASAC